MALRRLTDGLSEKFNQWKTSPNVWNLLSQKLRSSPDLMFLNPERQGWCWVRVLNFIHCVSFKSFRISRDKSLFQSSRWLGGPPLILNGLVKSSLQIDVILNEEKIYVFLIREQNSLLQFNQTDRWKVQNYTKKVLGDQEIISK